MSNSSGKGKIKFNYEKGIHKDVMLACKNLSKWLNDEFVFSKELCVKICNSYYVEATDGDKVISVFSQSFDNNKEKAIIKVAAGDYDELLKNNTTTDALAMILLSICHNIIHYFQWLDGKPKLRIFREIQAKKDGRLLLEEYSELRKFPFKNE